MAIHVSHDDDDIATLHERAQRSRAPTGEVPVVVLEVVPRTLREVFIEPLIAIEAPDDTDVHGGSKELLLLPSIKLTDASLYLTYRVDILSACGASSAMCIQNALHLPSRPVSSG
jgi:hypothetical protein